MPPEMLFSPAKLLISIVNKGGGRGLVKAAKQGGAPGSTRLAGRGLWEDCTGSDCAAQDVVLTLMYEKTEDIVGAVVEAALRDHESLSGRAVLLDVPKMLMRNDLCADSRSLTGGGSMKSGFTMITSITPQGQAEEIMAVAREAGARGGTVVSARGTGTPEDVKFFGISLAPEKEMLVIISETTYADAILAALGNLPVYREPGGGIIFTVNVDRFIPLGG